jgi:hypothetical protein
MGGEGNAVRLGVRHHFDAAFVGAKAVFMTNRAVAGHLDTVEVAKIDAVSRKMPLTVGSGAGSV